MPMVADRLKNPSPHTPAGTFFPNAWVARTQCNLTAARPCLLLAFCDTGRPRRLSALALMLGTGSGSCTAGKIPGIDAVILPGCWCQACRNFFFFSNSLIQSTLVGVPPAAPAGRVVWLSDMPVRKGYAGYCMRSHLLVHELLYISSICRWALMKIDT